MLIFFASYIFAARRPDATELLVPLFFLVAGFTAWRHIPLGALALTPFTARALASGAIPGFVAVWQRSRLARWNRRRMYTRELGHSEFILNWLVLLVVSASLAAFAPVFQAREQLKANKVLPIGAAEFVLARGITGNMFNNYDDGGYLIYRLAPTRKVFIDGRVDLYGDKFLGDFLNIYYGQANWKKKFEKLSINYAILDKDAPIRQLLKADPAFKEVFFDQHYAVLLRNPASPESAAR